MNRRRRKLTSGRRGVVVWATLFSIAGCGGDGLKLAPVEGTVTLNGQPVAEAGVLFVPTDPKLGPAAGGSTDQQGHFRLMCHNRDGAPIGENRVSITKADPFGDEVAEKDLENADFLRSRGLKAFKTKYLLPPVYANVETSKLTANVENKNNSFEFNLKSP